MKNRKIHINQLPILELLHHRVEDQKKITEETQLQRRRRQFQKICNVCLHLHFIFCAAQSKLDDKVN